MAVLKYKNPDTGEWEVIPHIIQGEKGDKGDKGDNYILTDDDKAEIANQISGDFVQRSEVVDNLVVNGTPQWDKIPNGNALQSFIEANSVSSAVTQSLSDSKKARARANIGAISQTELDEAVANADINGDYLSYSEAQELTDEQKELARENIGALAANAVVDSLVTSDNQFLPHNVPNGAAINDFATKYLIRCDVEQPELTPEEKEQARANIGASAAEIYVKAKIVEAEEEKEIVMPAYQLELDLTADAAATTSEITEETNGEIPTSQAVKNYVTSVLGGLDNRLQELLEGVESNVTQ